MPARRFGWRRPSKSAIAPPWEKPARTMRSLGTPRSFSRATRSRTEAADSRIPRSSGARLPVEGQDVVPGPHPIAAVDGDRPDRARAGRRNARPDAREGAARGRGIRNRGRPPPGRAARRCWLAPSPRARPPPSRGARSWRRIIAARIDYPRRRWTCVRSPAGSATSSASLRPGSSTAPTSSPRRAAPSTWPAAGVDMPCSWPQRGSRRWRSIATAMLSSPSKRRRTAWACP